jgi:hypothetical protein
MLKRIALLVFPLAIAGCAGAPINPAASTDHPANPNAPEAPIRPPGSTLTIHPSTEPAPTTQEAMPGMEHGDHTMEHGQGGAHEH